MNKSGFFEILNDTAKLNNLTISDLDEIIEEYPYFQIPYLLKTKLLHDSDNFKYDNFVKIAAIYVNDRAKLFNFIQSEISQNKEDKKDAVENIDTETVEKENITKIVEQEHIDNEPVNEEIVSGEKAELVEGKEEQLLENNIEEPEVKAEIVTESVVEDVVEKEPEKETEPEKAVELKSEKEKTLADKILEKLKTSDKPKEESIADKILRKIAESRKVSKEQDDKIAESLIEETPKTQEIQAEKEKTADLQETQKDTVLPSQKTETQEVEEKSIVENDEPVQVQSVDSEQFDILKEIESIDNSLPVFEPAFDISSLAPKPQPEEKKIDTEGMSFEEWLDFIDNNKKQASISNKKNKQDSLIEKFIKDTSPKKIKVKKDTGTDIEQVIKKSTEEKDDLITETLANIYIKQKLYDKAIKAFTKLSLKYPEKSIYFANRIEELNKLIKK